ncbi:ADP-ribosylglycohydrolase family protein [Gottfriedia acidiceleris]|uniref:ADP-ribosylglycohydrolase family protein n=1 Tax=Gottfriedia acidiceleris TaxID=371036 RepID=UPI003D1DAFCD
MNRKEIYEKVYGCLIGLSVGDALGAPTEGMTLEGIREKYNWVDGFISEDPVGTDDTEYSMLTSLILLKYGENLTYRDMTNEWSQYLLDQNGGFKGGGFSEVDAIFNLRKGLVAPYSGMDNHEMWSDGVAMRIAPVGVYFAGDPEKAAKISEIEARISHDRDGVYCGMAIAASVAYAMTGDSWEKVIQNGLDVLPKDSWSYRKISEAVNIGMKYSNVQEAMEELYNKVSIFYYPWADVAPEATALAYGVFAASKGDYKQAVLGGTNIGRDSDTIASMNGALSGALNGASVIPEDWKSRINVIKGVCVKKTKGIDIRDLSEKFTDVIVGRGFNE